VLRHAFNNSVKSSISDTSVVFRGLCPNGRR